MDRKQAWRTAFIGAAIAAIVTLPGLGGGTLWDNSETAYGEVAREILLTGDPVVMHLNGEPWFIQPPLYFWIAAAFAKVFGVTPFALRLPSALATIAMGAATGYAVTRYAGARAALLAATILSTSLMQAVVGRLAIMDALLDLAVTLAILFAYAALRGSPTPAFLAAWIAAGFGVLAKGPVAIVVTLIVLVPWAWWEHLGGRRLMFPRPAQWFIGAALFSIIVAPWFVLETTRVGPAALSELLGHYTVGRYLGIIENQTGPIYYYLPVVVLGFFPWVAFLVPALGAAARRAGDADGSLVRLALVWTAGPFIFFSLARTKLPNYLALELPALATLVALWFEEVAATARRREALAWTALVPLTIVAFAVAVVAFSRDNRLLADLHAVQTDLIALGITVLAGSLICSALLVQRRTIGHAPYALAVAAAGTVLLMALAIEPHVESFKPVPALAKIIETQRRPGDAVAIQGIAGAYALTFYTRPPTASLDNRPTAVPSSDPRRTICQAPRAFVIAPARRPVPDQTYGRHRQTLATAANAVLFLYDGPRCAI